MTILRPGDVQVTPWDAGGSPSFIGTQPVWSDESDATYVRHQRLLSIDRRDAAAARFPYAVVPDGLAITWHLRVSGTGGGCTFGLHFDGGSSISVNYLPFGTTGAVEELTGTLAAGSSGNIQIRQGLDATMAWGLWANVTSTNAADGGYVDSHEVWLSWDGGTTPPPTFTPAPPARLSGRMDGAIHGARRMDTRGPSRRGGFHPGGYY